MTPLTLTDPPVDLAESEPPLMPPVVTSPAAARFTRALYWVLPNLSQFDVKARVVHGQPVPFGYIATSTAYGLLYIAVLLVVATYVFSRRDFK